MVVAVTLAAVVLVVILAIRRSGPAPPAAAGRTEAPPTHGRTDVAPDGFSATGPLSTAIPPGARPASDSNATVANLVQQIRSHDGHVALNASSYTATLYTVGAHQAKVNVGFDNCQDRTRCRPAWPGHFRASRSRAGRSAQPAVTRRCRSNQPATNRLWEFWKFQRAASGRYSACWGGEITDVSGNPGVFPYPYGATASGLALAAFVLRAHEVASRYIDHALGVNVSAPAAGPYPGRRIGPMAMARAARRPTRSRGSASGSTRSSTSRSCT